MSSGHAGGNSGLGKRIAFVAALLFLLTAGCIVVCKVSYVRQGTSGNGHAGGGSFQDAGDGFVVVTSFYPLYIAALNIVDGVDGVTLSNLSEPKTGCLHDYQLLASDVRLLSNADLFLINGGGMESFIYGDDAGIAGFHERFPNLKVVSADENLPPEKLKKDNAHYWMDIDLYEIYVQKMAIALCDADTAHAGDYMDNYSKYREKLDKLCEEADRIGQGMSGEPGDENKATGAVILNEAFYYLVKETGMDVVCSIDLDDGAETSAEEMSRAVLALKDGGARFVFADSVYGDDTAHAICDEAGCRPIFLDPLTTGEYNNDAYLNGMEKNLSAIRDAGY